MTKLLDLGLVPRLAKIISRPGAFSESGDGASLALDLLSSGVDMGMRQTNLEETNPDSIIELLGYVFKIPVDPLDTEEDFENLAGVLYGLLSQEAVQKIVSTKGLTKDALEAIYNCINGMNEEDVFDDEDDGQINAVELAGFIPKFIQQQQSGEQIPVNVVIDKIKQWLVAPPNNAPDRRLICAIRFFAQLTLIDEQAAAVVVEDPTIHGALVNTMGRVQPHEPGFLLMVVDLLLGGVVEKITGMSALSFTLSKMKGHLMVIKQHEVTLEVFSPGLVSLWGFWPMHGN